MIKSICAPELYLRYGEMQVRQGKFRINGTAVA